MPFIVKLPLTTKSLLKYTLSSTYKDEFNEVASSTVNSFCIFILSVTNKFPETYKSSLNSHLFLFGPSW